MLQAQLRESREELLALRHRGERAAALRAQVHHIARRIQVLRLQQQGEGMELVQPRRSSGRGTHRHQAALTEELQKSLELEEYHHSILEADWLLELEVRPILIRRIDAVRGTCWFSLRSLSHVPGREQGHCHGQGSCMERAGHPGGDMDLVGLGRATTSPVKTNGPLGSPGHSGVRKESHRLGNGRGSVS